MVKPDDYNCKKCGRPVRYALLPKARMNVAFDARLIKGAGYHLTEVEDEDGVATGQWQATYVKVADRDPNERAWRQHNCPGFKEQSE